MFSGQVNSFLVFILFLSTSTPFNMSNKGSSRSSGNSRQAESTIPTSSQGSFTKASTNSSKVTKLSQKATSSSSRDSLKKNVFHHRQRELSKTTTIWKGWTSPNTALYLYTWRQLPTQDLLHVSENVCQNLTRETSTKGSHNSFVVTGSFFDWGCACCLYYPASRRLSYRDIRQPQRRSRHYLSSVLLDITWDHYHPSSSKTTTGNYLHYNTAIAVAIDMGVEAMEL